MTQLRILVTGSRDHRDYVLIHSALSAVLAEVPTIGNPLLIHGAQLSWNKQTGEYWGADYLADRAWKKIAMDRGMPLEIVKVSADWTGPCDPAVCRPGHRRPSKSGFGDYCPAAGPRRNQRMIDEHRPTIAVAFPLGDSRGTRDMIERLEDASIPVRIREAAPSGPPQLRLVTGGTS